MKLKYKLLIIIMLNILITTDNSVARLKAANLASKKDIAGFVKKKHFSDDKLKSLNKRKLPLREKCPNTEFFLVLIFPHLE